MLVKYNNNRFKFIGDVVEKESSKINQAMTKKGKFEGFISVDPVTYLMQWNNTANTPYYIPIIRSFNKARINQEKRLQQLKDKFIEKGYKPIGKIFHSY